MLNPWTTFLTDADRNRPMNEALTASHPIRKAIFVRQDSPLTRPNTMTEPTAPQPAADYDSPWKDVLEHAFPEFMAFYFPEAHAQIDWAQGHEFKNTELRQVVRDAELGRRLTADALVQVTLTSGEQRWIYMHIEVQGQRDTDFAQRMFTYNYRLL
jgi:hypothetical protein